MIARLIHFAGYVQGVGFRYTARSIARQYEVTGYVMNLPDGQVELLVEGTEEDVTHFINDVKAEMNTYINRHDVQDVPPTGAYKQFTVRYY